MPLSAPPTEPNTLSCSVTSVSGLGVLCDVDRFGFWVKYSG